MSFTQVFGGSTIVPTFASYAALTIASNTALFWPLDASEGDPLVAAALDVVATTSSLQLQLPAATAGGKGVVTMVANVGSNSFSLTDTSGNVICNIATTEAWLIVLTDNSTANGVWRALQMASTVSSGVSGALAGAGLQSVGGALRTRWLQSTLTANTVLTSSYRATLIQWTGGTAGILQLDALATLAAGWYAAVSNQSAVNVTITTTGGEFINGETSITLLPGQSATFIAAATQFVGIGYLIGVVPIASGGTGAATSLDALTNLGGTTLGIGLFSAASASAAIALLGLNNFTFTESSVSTNQNIASTASNTIFVCTAALIATLPLTTTLNKNFAVGIYGQGGAVTVTPQATDAIAGLSAGTSFTVPRGGSAMFITDANGKWWPIFLSTPLAGMWCAAAGTVTAITGAYSPPIAALVDGLVLSFRASGANTSPVPTFAPDGLAATTITRDGGNALIPGDIAGANAECTVRYNLANTRWELLNPSNPPLVWAAAGGTVDAITATVSTVYNGLFNGLLVGFRATGANLTTTPTFNLNGNGASAIVKAGGASVVPGDIAAANAEVLLRFNAGTGKWMLLNPASTSPPWAVAAGTVDAITATYSPANGALYDGLLLSFRASGANTSTTPTFAPDGLTARTITRSGGRALIAGDIPGAAAECLLRYNLANTRWELVNPAPTMVQSGTGTTGVGGLLTVNFSPAFPNSCDSVVCTLVASATDAYSVSAQSKSASNFVAYSTLSGVATSGIGFNWIATGH